MEHICICEFYVNIYNVLVTRSHIYKMKRVRVYEFYRNLHDLLIVYSFLFQALNLCSATRFSSHHPNRHLWFSYTDRQKPLLPQLTILTPLNSVTILNHSSVDRFLPLPIKLSPSLSLSPSPPLLSPRSIISSSLEHCLLPNQLSSAIFFCFGGENAVENFSNDRGTRHLGELADWQAVSYQSFPSPGMRFPALVCP